MKKIKKILAKAVPLWMVILITINSTMIMGIAQYYLMRAELRRNLSELAKTTKSPEDLVTILKQEVLPQDGYTTSLKWKDLGKQLVESGAIDKKKYEEIFTSTSDGADHMKYLNEASEDNIRIDEKNSRFMVNTFWALGLVQKSKVFDEGPMKTGGTPTENFASTGGWTLGAKPVMEIYSSRELLPLNSFQQDLVKKIAENVFRPCCGNSTAFPDCNHGMALLGIFELMAAQGATESEMFQAGKYINSFWFPGTAFDTALYFKNKDGKEFKDIDPKVYLSKDIFSAFGAQTVKKWLIDKGIQEKPPAQGGGCGV